MSEKAIHHKFILLGSSRGLGWEVYQQLLIKYPQSQFLLISRKIFQKSEKINKTNTELLAFDFSQQNVNIDLLNSLQQFQPTHILYIAGGGPYGVFESKKWSDHVWAMNVNYNSPAQILHFILSHPKLFPDLVTVLFVGSKIAEDQPDPMASSYCAAKHALKGLITTLQKENSSSIQIKLFSPGYIDTALLPEKSWPREMNLAKSAEIVASDLINILN